MTPFAQSAIGSPSAHEFRLLLNELAISELRRMFCSDEGACVLVGSGVCRCRQSWSQGPVHVGVGVSVSRAADIRRRGYLPVTQLKRKEWRNGFRQSGANGETRYTLEPAAAAPAADTNRVIRPHPPANFDSCSTGQPHLR